MSRNKNFSYRLYYVAEQSANINLSFWEIF
jgi:hypothetical protein